MKLFENIGRNTFKLSEIGLPGEEVTIEKECPVCKEVNKVTVKKKDLEKWQRREMLIQRAFPYLDAGKREILKTGICPKCWDKLFKR